MIILDQFKEREMKLEELIKNENEIISLRNDIILLKQENKYKILDIIANIVRSIPFLILLILLIPFTKLIVGQSYGSTATVVPLVIAAIPFIARMVESSLREVDQGIIEASLSMGASPMQIIKHVVLPSSLPSILTGIRIGLGVGWSTLVAAELVGASEGLGFMVQSSSQLLATDVVIVGILIIAVIAFILEIGLRRLQKKLVPWDKQSQ